MPVVGKLHQVNKVKHRKENRWIELRYGETQKKNNNNLSGSKNEKYAKNSSELEVRLKLELLFDFFVK